MQKVRSQVFGKSAAIIAQMLLISGCQWGYNQAEAGHATDTIVAAFGLRGIPKAEQPVLDCEMLQISRDFTCLFTLAAPEAEAFANKLALSATPLKFSKWRYFYSAYPKQCESKFSALDQVVFFEPSEKYPAGLEALRYLTLYYDPQSQQACLQAGHSYVETREKSQ